MPSTRSLLNSIDRDHPDTLLVSHPFIPTHELDLIYNYLTMSSLSLSLILSLIICLSMYHVYLTVIDVIFVNRLF